MKYKVTNTSQYPIERLGFVFQPGASTEIELRSERQYITVSAPRPLIVEAVEEIKEVEEKPEVTEVTEDVKKDKVSKKSGGKKDKEAPAKDGE